MRLGGLKYIRPFAYMGTKIMADHFHSVLFSRAPRTNNPILDLTRFQVADHRVARREIARSQRIPIRSLQHPPGDQSVLPPRPDPQPAYEYPPIREVKSAATWQPAPYREPNRPAAIKRNGGLRGSTATLWK